MGQARAYLLASLAAFYLITLATPQVTAYITDELETMWGSSRVVDDSIALSLHRGMTSAFRSKKTYLFGRIDIDIKLVPGNSAGTVTTFYTMTEGSWNFHNEIDIEFLGNSSGDPYTMHTNLYARGKGSREKGYRLPFDPTQDFHTYSIIWSQQSIQILADNKLLRHIKNKESTGGAPYPNFQPMRVYCTIWDADDWATQGGRVKTDWSLAPFTAYFRNFKATSCSPNQGSKMCGQELDDAQKQQVQEVDANSKIYDYCADPKRRIGSTEECKSQ
ncbi:xyloglucan endotransglucosylase/hydrolase 2-like [Lolium rigidum]|uniref:xyloglucan endotransglucosylase/hydrolase 2-like n=1 Tax=Lolium rigidum TaxID=89674 RepID=UPI001F5C3620|nr:xyloglucan endotransglucosylase/hydrolase 2-like [Lolium rigidum]